MSQKILIIDDDPTILEMFKLALSRAGFDVTTASGGQLGLTAYDEVTPDLCLVDIAMPGMDGYQVIEAIRRKEEDEQHSAIVVLTAHEQPVMRDYADEVGVDLYLTKPLRPADLITKVKDILSA
jgi:DNA-binding response OmpR family regulator